MQKIITIILSLAMAASLAACTGETKPKDQSSSTESVASSQSSSQVSSSQASSTDAVSSDAGTAEEGMAEGMIQDGTMNTLTIVTADGESLIFSTTDADTSKSDGLTIGTTARVYYTGTISGTDTTGATVTRVEQQTNASVAEAPAADMPVADAPVGSSELVSSTPAASK